MYTNFTTYLQPAYVEVRARDIYSSKKWGFIDAGKMQADCRVSQNAAVYENTWLTCSFWNNLFFRS